MIDTQNIIAICKNDNKQTVYCTGELSKNSTVRKIRIVRRTGEKLVSKYANFLIAQVPLAQITWYHHITLLSRIIDNRNMNQIQAVKL